MSIPINEKRRCYNCKFSYRQDEGYSNYTVENTAIDCLLSKNPNLPTDEGYRLETDDHEFMTIAENCDGFVLGEALYIDCDQEAVTDYGENRRNTASYYTTDAEVIAAWENKFGVGK